MNKPLLRVLLCATTALAGCEKKHSDGNVASKDASPSDLPAIYQSFWSHGIAASDEPALLARLPYERISLERRPGMATTPNYRVIFHRSGRAEMSDRSGPSEVRSISEINPFEYARLCYLIERSGFVSMRPEYTDSASDLETVVVSVTNSSGERRVSQYGVMGPIELWTVQQAIEGLKSRTVWESSK